jgi:pSer/pThr/pTyr-binding forkhead associated (FHA) protein
VPDQLLNLLKIFLLLLLYLFFLRVLRAVWAEVSPPKAVEAPARKHSKQTRRAAARKPSGKGGQLALRVLLPPELKGRSFPLGEEVTLGRAAGCQVTIDDTYASQLHARVFQRDGTVYVEDLGSTNGTYLNRQKVTGPMVFGRGDKLQIGNTVLELTS